MVKKAKVYNLCHISQQDFSDCGVACLKSVLLYFGTDVSLELLRNYSGTSTQGTTLLGLLQAGRKLGLEIEGFEATIQHLRKCDDICILHVLLDKNRPHFVVCYGYQESEDVFWIGDPSEPQVKKISSEDLRSIWKDQKLLLIKPTEKLRKADNVKKQKISWFSNLIREDFGLLGVAIGFSIVISVLGLSTAVFSQKLLDDILPSGDSSKLLVGLFVLMILLFVKTGFNYIRSVLLMRQGRDFNIRTLDFFYSSLLNLPKAFFDNRKTGDMIARMNDTQRIQKMISQLASQASIDVVLGLVALTAIFIYDWKIGLVSLIWFPIFFMVFRKYRPEIMKHQKGTMKLYSLTESQFIDNIQGIGDIKRNNKQDLFFRITRNVYQKLHQIWHDLALVSAQYGLTVEFFGVLFLVFILGWSSFSVLENVMTLGAMMAILQLLGMVTAATSSLAQITISIDEAVIAFDRMNEFTAIEREYDLAEETKLLRIDEFVDLRIVDLAFRFPGRSRLLTNVSFDLKKGEWIAILGESGCGKSTLLQMLQKFYDKEEGRIEVNGVELDLIAFENWRSKIGVVPQEIKLFNGTLIDNILLGEQLDDIRQLESFFKFYGFDEVFRKFPNGYSTILGESGVNISGGQKQLVGLARALYKQPELLLLDEPTSSLDRNTELFVLELLAKIKSEVAIILLTHKLKTAKKADRIHVIENGTISKKGNHEQLLQSENLYSKAWFDLVED